MTPKKTTDILDISDVKKAMEKSYRAGKETEDIRTKLIGTIDSVPNLPVQAYNIKGEVVFWNSASEELYGYKKAEVKDVFPEDP